MAMLCDIWRNFDDVALNIEQKGLFSRTISELDYTHVQDVTSEVHGPIHTLLNYGDVHVQTAGTHGKFTFRNIPRPEKIKTLQSRHNRLHFNYFGLILVFRPFKV